MAICGDGDWQNHKMQILDSLLSSVEEFLIAARLKVAFIVEEKLILFYPHLVKSECYKFALLQLTEHKSPLLPLCLTLCCTQLEASYWVHGV